MYDFIFSNCICSLWCQAVDTLSIRQGICASWHSLKDLFIFIYRAFIVGRGLNRQRLDLLRLWVDIALISLEKLLAHEGSLAWGRTPRRCVESATYLLI